MAVLGRQPTDKAKSLYEPEPAEVVSVEKLTDLENVYALQLASGHPLGHLPGQFVQLALLGIGECPISICSSPTRPNTFELCVRRVGEVTEHIHRLREGDTIGVRGPLGNGFDVHELHGKDILIVAGGLGLAPVRSLIQYILDERARFGQFHLLYGARSPGELLFRNDLTLWRERDDVNFHMTVDRPDEQWRGRSGVVTTLFSEVPRLEPGETQVVIVGPPVMFKFVVLEVLARRIHQRNIFCSLERRMKCGVGKCGHCQANNVYVCLEGPVFRYGELKALREAIE
ncbi:MAG: FAD/NAD(P)-binding protein [Phycisphaerales bacterium]|nr:MAG: FAD/NAD(P)-binding protein [Phycisphaerales bacterium]